MQTQRRFPIVQEKIQICIVHNTYFFNSPVCFIRLCPIRQDSLCAGRPRFNLQRRPSEVFRNYRHRYRHARSKLFRGYQRWNRFFLNIYRYRGLYGYGQCRCQKGNFLFAQTNLQTYKLFCRWQRRSGNIPVKLLPVSLYSLSGDKITAYMQDFFDKNDKGEFASLSDEEFYSRYVKGILDIVSGSLSSISYSNEVTVSVTITRDGTAYSISPESSQKLIKLSWIIQW